MLNDPYLEVLHQFIQIKHRLHIVEVGANDGKLNDPIYEFCIDYSEQTDILLVEPNPKLLPYLEENYQTHPSYEIANCAIGDQGFLTLHVMKEEAWPEFQPEYADAWPIYRAPTGITSANRGFVEAALTAEGVDPTGKIESIDVPSKSLPTLLGELNRPLRIDVLQIDAEGYDDAVIYASKLEMTSPAIIYFETDHIELSRLQDLKRYLERLGYTLFTSRFNCLCISRHAPLSIIM